MNQKKKPAIFQGVTSCFFALMITVFLFCTGTNGFQGIADAKYPLFLTICGGYVGCMLLLMAEMTLTGNYRLSSIRTLFSGSTWTQRFMVIYLTLTWLSALLSPHFPITVLGATRDEGALTITIYVLTFLLVSIYGRIDKWTLPLLSLSVSFFDIICILQLFGFNPFTLYPEGYNYFGAYVDYSGAYLGTIGNADLVAAFLCIVVPIFWVSLLRCHNNPKWLLLIPLGLSVFVLLKMWVLAGLVGVFAGGVISLCVVLPVSENTRKRLWGVLIIGAITTLALVFFIDVGDGLFHEVHLMLHGQAEDSFGSGRIHIWRSVLERIPEHLWFGSGPDTMHLAGLEPFKRYDERLNMLLVAEIDLAHNDYLNIVFHQGILALITYLAALTVAAKNWLKYAPRSAATAAIGSAVLCYCVQVFFSFSLCMTAPYFWITLALLETTYKDMKNGGT